mmetsp:Transcript_56831/g.176244  ORF Transcript_56831/g.176244 Transcript_56831/m.176244 type:complete len:291 (+) Transcript_56831:557-1429(+)
MGEGPLESLNDLARRQGVQPRVELLQRVNGLTAGSLPGQAQQLLKTVSDPALLTQLAAGSDVIPEAEAEGVPLVRGPDALSESCRPVQVLEGREAPLGRGVQGADDMQPLLHGPDGPVADVGEPEPQSLLELVDVALARTDVADPRPGAVRHEFPEIRGLRVALFPQPQGNTPAMDAVQVVEAAELADVEAHGGATTQESWRRPPEVGLCRGIEGRSVHRPNPDSDEVVQEPLHVLQPHHSLVPDVSHLDGKLQRVEAGKEGQQIVRTDVPLVRERQSERRHHPLQHHQP